MKKALLTLVLSTFASLGLADDGFVHISNGDLFQSVFIEGRADETLTLKLSSVVSGDGCNKFYLNGKVSKYGPVAVVSDLSLTQTKMFCGFKAPTNVVATKTLELTLDPNGRGTLFVPKGVEVSLAR